MRLIKHMDYKIFWCKVNKYYTDKWLSSDLLRNKNGIFIASCVVTDKAKKKWLKFVQESLNELKNNEKIYISWCWAFKDWEAQNDFFKLYPELEENKEKIEILWEDPNEEKNDIKINIPSNLYTKKFVLIQWWCDSFCTFCLTVIKRWKHFSRDKEEIVKEINDFVASWWKEAVLTWINLWAWWLKSTNEIWKSHLSELLEYILQNTEIQRLRISSLWPEFVDDKCLEIFKNKRIYPHFHFSVQSWSSKILKSMARHYDWEYIKNLLIKCKNLKREDWVNISLWADIIVGFPWETDEDFQDTYNLVQKAWIQKLHAFPFSAHEMWESVPAWKFPDQVDEKIKKERMDRLMKLWDKIRKDFISSQKQKELQVLIEVQKDWKWKGWTQNYIEATNKNFEVTSWEIKRNEIVVWKLI